MTRPVHHINFHCARASTSKLLASLAANLLMLVVALLVWLIVESWLTEAVPLTPFACSEAPENCGGMNNHGPWRYRCDLRARWHQIATLLLYTFPPAALSACLKFNVRALTLAVLSLATFVAFMTTYWLVD